MRVRIKMDSVQRLIRPVIDRRLSPEAQARMLADRAKQEIDKAKVQNRRALGFDPAVTVTVDGKVGAALTTVKPEGRIVAEFDIVSDVLTWIRDELKRLSPVLSGDYRRSHRLFMDGLEVSFDVPPAGGKRYIFLNEQPYARKIEPNARRTEGQSKQARDGVYMALSEVAHMRYGNVARIGYGFEAIAGVQGRAGRQPAIFVEVY